MATETEIVEYDIRLAAQGALVQLAELTASTSSFNTKLKETILAVESFAVRTGMSFEKVKSLFRSIDQEFAGGKGSSVVFGGAGSSSWDKITKSVQMSGKAMQNEQIIVEKTGEKLSHLLLAKQRLYDQKMLNAAQKEQSIVEKQGDALQRQLGLYGQVSRTAAETANYLKSFVGTESGQSILTKFFGDYKASQGVVQQVNTIKSAITSLSKSTGASFQQAGQVIRQQFSQIPGITNQVNQAVRQMGKEFEQAEKKATGSISVIRIALGILVSMLIHQVLQAFQTAFTTAIHNLRETELAIYNLINAERRLSEEGIDVTPQGLQETIDSVRELVPVLSQIQAEELVSRIATNVAPSLKLTNEQMRQMAESVALLYVRNKALGKSFEEVESQLTNAFLTGRVSQGINNLGVKLSDQIVKDEALRLGLVETEEEFNNLTGEMEAQIKASAMLSVVYKNAQQDIGSLGEYLGTTDAAIEKTRTAWNDFLTILATKFGPVIIEYLTGVIYWLEKASDWLTENQQKAENFTALLAGAARVMVEIGKIRSEQSLFEQATNSAENFKRVTDAFKGGVQDALDSFKGLEDAADTPTVIDNLSEAVEQFDASNMIDELDDILDKARDAQQDLDIDLGRKTMDLDIEYDRKAEDAYIDFQRKVQDINQETEDKIEEAKEKRREEDQKREEEYQNKLWELQQKYLMDLEDALHERDARQIIRLQRQYELEKESLARKNELDAKESKIEEQQAIKDAKQEQKDKIEDATVDYQRKLADLNTAKAREQADLQTWYDREQADLQLSQQRQLQSLIEGWVEKQLVTQANAQAVYEILATYFGPGGLTDSIWAYMQSSLSTAGMMAAAGLNTLGIGEPLEESSPISAPATSQPAPFVPVWKPRPGGYAEGGSFLATTPQSINVGERGPEVVQTTPIGRLGSDVNKFFMGAGKESVGGAMEIGVTLSPDLEARVIRRTLDETAGVILKVNRTKV